MADEGTPGGMKPITSEPGAPVTQQDVSDAVAKAMSARDVSDIKKGLEDLGKKFDNFLDTLAANYVTKTEFVPVKNIVYGAVGIILTSSLVGILYVATHLPK